MDLELSEDQIDLRDNIRVVLEGICPPVLVREAFDGQHDPTQLWGQMVDLFWTGLAIPESAGGIGLSFVEVGILAEELGRVAAPGPMLTTLSQFAPILLELDETDLLAEVCEGTRSGTLAFAEANQWEPRSVEAVAAQDGSNWTISGHKSGVLSALHVDSMAVVARDANSSELGIFLVESAAWEATASGPLDPGLGIADVSFDSSPAVLMGEVGDPAKVALIRAVEQSSVAMALHTVGACRRIFEVTLEYAKVREQYDQVIGSFQALKHRFADMFLAVERANAVGYFAAVAIAEDDPRRNEASHLAKAAAGDCQRLLAEDGLQLHGGIGYTWENDLHFLLKRAKSGELLCGSSTFHRSQLAELLGLTAEVSA
jgi:alkylation response protein AidB-like acyl-CoA dehydrogenase